MQEMLEYIVKNLVSNPDAVEVVLENQGKTKVFKVKVDGKDLGSVIGRGGNIANAIRIQLAITEDIILTFSILCTYVFLLQHMLRTLF